MVCQPSSCPGCWDSGTSLCVSVSHVPPSRGSRVTSTVLSPGGNPELVQELAQVRQPLRAGSV